jgi:hypothetical protein
MFKFTQALSTPSRALTVFPEVGRADSMYRGSGGGGRQQQQQQQQQLSLFSILNKTRTAAGTRCLKRYIGRERHDGREEEYVRRSKGGDAGSMAFPLLVFQTRR